MRAKAPWAAAVSRRDYEKRQAAIGPWPRESPSAPERLRAEDGGRRHDDGPPRHVPLANGRVGLRHQFDPGLCDQSQPASRMPKVLLLRECLVLLGRADPQELQARIGHRCLKIAVRHEGHFGPSLLQRAAQADQGIDVPEAAKRCQQDFHERTYEGRKMQRMTMAVVSKEEGHGSGRDRHGQTTSRPFSRLHTGKRPRWSPAFRRLIR